MTTTSSKSATPGKSTADAGRHFAVAVRLRLFDSGTLAYGKGVNDLLRLCGEHGSVRKAAGVMRMSYRKALAIIQRAEACFNVSLLDRTAGGRDGGGSTLTPFGERLVAAFSRLEAELTSAAQEQWLAETEVLPVATQTAE